MSSNYLVQGDLSKVIAGVYDAAISPDMWPRVLDDCREFVGGTSAAIFAKDVTGSRRQLFHVDGRLDPEQTEVYFKRLAPMDPSNTVQVYAEIEQGIITSQRLDPDDFAQSRFAAEWAIPQGIIDVGFATLERRGDWAALFGVFRHERDGFGDDVMAQRLSLLAPHVRRAIKIAGILGHTSRETTTLREMIDGLATAVIVIDDDGRLLQANSSAQALLGQRNMNAVGASFVDLDRSAMRQLASMPRSTGSTFIETTTGKRIVAHVLPLTSGSESFMSAGGSEPVAAIFLQPAEFELPSIPECLARAFHLTPAELRVALATLRHDKVADVAENLGISEATVKTHLSRVFSKTDTKRQADIVKLVAAFKTPLTIG
jgi:DNA-binding CsgD family transcriptional regulator/PAS domain-containing protein